MPPFEFGALGLGMLGFNVKGRVRVRVRVGLRLGLGLGLGSLVRVRF